MCPYFRHYFLDRKSFATHEGKELLSASLFTMFLVITYYGALQHDRRCKG